MTLFRPVVHIDKTNKLKAAEETLKLRLHELELARKASLEAIEKLDELIIESLNSNESLERVDGALVSVADFDYKHYVYAEDSFHALVPASEILK